MYAKICAAIVLIQVFGAAAFAADEKNLPGPQPLNPFRGTPEEEAACAPDAIPDTFRVLACLQENRQKIRKVCLKVLEDHGQ